MRPNWFIAFPVRAPLELPSDPERVRVFHSEDRHLTAAFLGGVSASDARLAWKQASGAILAPITIELGEARLLGGRRPTALAAVVDEGFEDASSAIEEVQSRLVEAGLLAEARRRPLPHVTLARIHRRAKDSERAAARAWAERWVPGARAQLTELALYTWSENRSQRLFQIVERRDLF